MTEGCAFALLWVLWRWPEGQGRAGLKGRAEGQTGKDNASLNGQTQHKLNGFEGKVIKAT